MSFPLPLMCTSYLHSSPRTLANGVKSFDFSPSPSFGALDFPRAWKELAITLWGMFHLPFGVYIYIYINQNFHPRHFALYSGS
jgi:hypothetical protein